MSNVLPSPLGARGATPYQFTAPSPEFWAAFMDNIPCTRGEIDDLSIRVPWFMAHPVAKYVGAEPPELPLAPQRRMMTGLERFRQYGFHEVLWPAQKKAILERANHDYWVNAVPLRGGKSIISLAGGILRGCEKFAVFCPGYLKYNWLTEILKWIPDAHVLTLEGRRGTKGRVGMNERVINNRSELEDIAENWANFILCNFDILQCQKRKDGGGKLYYIPELLGMSPFLAKLPVDKVIVDEAHEIGGYLSARRGDHTRGGIFNQIYRFPHQAKIIEAATATPTGSGDLARTWQLFRILAGADRDGSLWGYAHWPFARRYMDGQYVPNTSEFGPPEVWDQTGRSNQGEFKYVWKCLVYQKTETEMAEDMPKLRRHVVPIDPGDAKWKVPKSVTAKQQKEMIQRAAVWKADGCQPFFIEALRSGKNILILTRHRKPLDKATEGLRKAVRSEKLDVVIHQMHGEIDPKLRKVWGESVRRSTKPVAILATMDSVRGGLSFGGVNEVHVLELHPDPSRNTQATGRVKERGFGVEVDGVLGIDVFYYFVLYTYDDRLVNILVPKMEVIADIEGSEDAADMVAKIRKDAEEELSNAWQEMAGMVNSKFIHEED